MAEENERPQDDHTEAATPRRLQRARDEGQVPVSREMVTLAGLVATALVALIAGPALLRALTVHLSGFVAHSHSEALIGQTGWHHAAFASVLAAGPIVLAVLVAGIGATVLQTGLLLHGGALQPKLSRISPGAGMRRMLGAENLAETVRSFGKLALVGLAIWWVLPTEPSLLAGLPFQGMAALLDHTGDLTMRVLLATIAAQTVIAVADTGWVRFRHARQLRMSRQDMRDELKDTEGDPQIRARIRQIRQQRARRRMLAAVPEATVVVTNPTHYAVALAYDRATNAAPRVVAKGVDSMAARIREMAEVHRVPVVANPPLARALYRVELDDEIPAEHYPAVAEIVAYVWRLGQRTREQRIDDRRTQDRRTRSEVP
jgi:flagellar biosynthetic protein FlhB